MIQIADHDIGGAIVARTFTMGGRQMKRGDQLTREQVLDINLPNRRALTDSSYLEIYPKADAASERFVVGLGKDRYNVIEGRVINDQPMSRDAAEKLLRS